MRGARDGSLLLFLNFDGEHVDAEVSRRVVDFVGADRVIGMTDRVEGRSLAGEPLEPAEGSTLLYQRDGVVAAGSQGLDRQMRNLRRLRVDEASIWRMFSFLPLEALGRPVSAEGGPAGPASYVEADGSRRVLEPAAGGAPA
jgi:N-acetylglucosamine-6-phosphate deacetylase